MWLQNKQYQLSGPCEIHATLTRSFSWSLHTLSSECTVQRTCWETWIWARRLWKILGALLEYIFGDQISSSKIATQGQISVVHLKSGLVWGAQINSFPLEMELGVVSLQNLVRELSGLWVFSSQQITHHTTPLRLTLSPRGITGLARALSDLWGLRSQQTLQVTWEDLTEAQPHSLIWTLKSPFNLCYLWLCVWARETNSRQLKRREFIVWMQHSRMWSGKDQNWGWKAVENPGESFCHLLWFSPGAAFSLFS